MDLVRIFFLAHRFEALVVFRDPPVQLGLPDDIFGPMPVLRRDQRVRHQEPVFVAARRQEKPAYPSAPAISTVHTKRERNHPNPFLRFLRFLCL